MSGAWKISGWYLFAIGVIHTLVGLFLFPDILRDIWSSGLIGSVRDQLDRNVAFFFFYFGFLLSYIGLQWQEQLRRYKEPRSRLTAWGITVITITGAIIMPISGFWLVMPLCFIMLYPHYFNKGGSFSGQGR